MHFIVTGSFGLRRRFLRASLLGTTALVALGLALTPSPSRATDWTGTNPTGWFDPANWSGGVPTNATDAIIDTVTSNPAEVDGAAAQAHYTFVGDFGTGTLTIQNGGTVSNTAGYLGYNAGATGTVTVDGATSSWTNSDVLYVGNEGTGTLTIQNGGTVSNTAGYLGYNAGATGTVTVDGAGSTWTNTSSLLVGHGGTGTLTIQNGGAVSSSSGSVGHQSDSTGTVTVDGAGSSWTNAGALYVGSNGTGTLTIQNGGTVSNVEAFIGFLAGSTGSTGTVAVDGAGSSWTNASNLLVGFFGTGALTIQNGGAVSSISGSVGFNAGSTGTVTVDGAGSSWTITSGLTVGNEGTGTLNIQNGGAVSNTEVFIGYFAGATGTVTVDGTGSSWTNTGNLSVGLNGTGALTIRNGGAVSNADGFIGHFAGTGTVTVDGAGSTWTSTGGLYVGNQGTGSLTIRNGGAVSNGIGFIGYSAGVTATVLVDGAGSSWTGSSGLYVGVSGTGTLTIQNGGAVSNAQGFIGSVAGSTGTVTVNGAGSSWTNTGNFYVGASGTGTLTILNGGAVSNATGYVGEQAGSTGTVTVDGAGASWTNSSNLYIGLNGTGTLTIRNGGTVSAQAVVIANAIGTTGTLNIGAASGQAAAAPGTLNTPTIMFGDGTGQIVFNHTATNYAFAPVISGAGSVRVEAGTTILSGANTYTGATTVNGGTLSVNGSIAASSSLTMNSGTTLGGNGFVPTTVINSGATLAPGNSIGTLTVNGNLTFNTGTTYAVEVSPTAADRINVIGSATLTGATVNAVALPGSFRQQTYTIVNATAGFGGTQFAGLTGSTFAPGARNPHLTYDANNVFLVLEPGTIQLPAGTGGNQSSVAGSINSAVESGATPPAGFDVLLNMSGASLTNALGQVSGQPGASASQSGSAAPGQFVNAIFSNAFGGGSGGNGVLGFAEAESAFAAKPKMSREASEAYAAVTPRDRRTLAFEGRWGVFASVYGGNNRVGGDNAAGTNTTTSRTYGAVAGADYRFTRDTQAGFALGGAGSSFSIDGGFGSGKADIFNVAIYGKHNIGAAYVAGALSYSWQDTITDRTVTISGVDQLHASFKAQAFTARLEGGWRFATPMLGVTPYAALQSTTFFMPAYAETATSGSNQFALSYASKTTTNLRTELGAKVDKAMLVQSGIFTLTGRAAWAHDSNVDSSATATFQSLPSATFTSNGARPSPNGALLSLGGEMAWHQGWSVAANFDGEFSRTTTGYSGKATLRYAW